MIHSCSGWVFFDKLIQVIFTFLFQGYTLAINVVKSRYNRSALSSGHNIVDFFLIFLHCKLCVILQFVYFFHTNIFVSSIGFINNSVDLLKINIVILSCRLQNASCILLCQQRSHRNLIRNSPIISIRLDFHISRPFLTNSFPSNLNYEPRQISQLQNSFHHFSVLINDSPDNFLVYFSLHKLPWLLITQPQKANTTSQLTCSGDGKTVMEVSDDDEEPELSI